MIARIWRGAVRPEDADAYVASIEDTGIREYRETPGNISAHILRRDLPDRTEIITFTFWDTMTFIRAFAGDDPERAVYYPKTTASSSSARSTSSTMTSPSRAPSAPPKPAPSPHRAHLSQRPASRCPPECRAPRCISPRGRTSARC